MPRLDVELVQRGIVTTRSQAENYIKLGYVQVNGKTLTRPGELVSTDNKIKLTLKEQYVSRSALKLASLADKFKLDFKNKTVLDVGSSTGGFTDYALRNGTKKVVAVDVGADQMHPILRGDPRVELHERLDVRRLTLDVRKAAQDSKLEPLTSNLDIALVDVSFISLRKVLPHIASLSRPNTQILALLKPQFEAGKSEINRGVVKNERLRRQIIKDFENWVKKLFTVTQKADSEIAGTHGNRERFYLLQKPKR